MYFTLAKLLILGAAPYPFPYSQQRKHLECKSWPKELECSWEDATASAEGRQQQHGWRMQDNQGQGQRQGQPISWQQAINQNARLRPSFPQQINLPLTLMEDWFAVKKPALRHISVKSRNTWTTYSVYIMTPLAHMSTGRPYPAASSYIDTFSASGARYPGVPHSSTDNSTSTSLSLSSPQSHLHIITVINFQVMVIVIVKVDLLYSTLSQSLQCAVHASN